MKTGAVIAALAVLALALDAGAAPGEKPIWTENAVSPDGDKTALAQGWDHGGNEYCEVTVRIGKTEVYKDIFQLEREVNYIKFSWSPDSRVLLIGEGYKASMDLSLLRFVNGKALAAHFDSDELVDDPMLKALPFRDALKNSAPNARVAWHSIRWGNDNRCNMVYIFHGIGHEGEALLQIDWGAHDPKLKIIKISPVLDPKNLNDI